MNSDTIIVVPCHNEAKRLDVDAFARYLATSVGVSLLLVDDGSTDATPQVLEALRSRHSQRVLVYRVEKNGGKAEAVRRGIIAAVRRRPAYVGYWDADLATPLEVIEQFREVLHHRSEASLVLGCRIPLLGRQVRRKRSRHLAGRAFATAASAVLGLPVFDTQCGAKLFRVTSRTAVLFGERFRSRWIFDVEILARWLTNGGGAEAIVEVPLERWEDVAGSRLKPRDFLVAALDLAAIRWRYRSGRAATACISEASDDALLQWRDAA
jgi:glycosyltransferase involved in cell wall biosynthesis